jgi:hypothetical protein
MVASIMVEFAPVWGAILAGLVTAWLMKQDSKNKP